MSDTDAMRPRPAADADSRPFWEACAREELLGQRCGQCGVWRWPPRRHCPHCHAADPVWQGLPGTGKVAGFTVVHRAMDPAFAEEIPLAIVHVELDGTGGEMVLMSNLQAGEWEHVRVGSPVTVLFRRLDHETALPLFTLRNTTTKE